MIQGERYDEIVKVTNEKGFVSTKTLATLFNVTETTIRRDCEELEKQGLLIRVHGGAKSINKNNILTKDNEIRMKERYMVHLEQKQTVAKKAASLVHDGDCIFLDGGSSIVPMLEYLMDKKIKIVTHSILVANAFVENENIELFMVGGKLLPEYQMSVGPITEKTVSLFNFDHCFISCAGIDLSKRMVYTAEMETMAVKQQVIHQSIHKYLLIDSSKLQVKGFCSFIDSSDFDAIICDDGVLSSEEDLPVNYIIA